MNPLSAWPWPPGYELLRLLAEGRGGIVALARDAKAELVAIKLLRLADNVNAEQALARHQGLQALTNHSGLLPILACGLTTDRQWLWEAFPPADGTDGSPASLADDYQPSNLRTRVIEHDPLSAKETIRVGLTIAEGLACLHGAGLVHRDVKPGNFFMVGGKATLGDYGLVSPPGGTLDFAGTEGFMPPDGAKNQAADVFALGKSLYELWTGCDRLEFPTIPKPILEGAEWRPAGAALNEVLLRACSTHSGDRYQTAAEFSAHLKAVAQGRSPAINRRRWLVGAAAASGLAVGGGLLWLGTHQKPVMRWRLLKEWRNLPSSWGNYQPIADEQRDCLYQFMCWHEDKVIHRIDLGNFDRSSRRFKLDGANANGAILHPVERTLWFAEEGRGPVWRVDPETGEVSRVGGLKPAVDTDHNNAAYWNPLTQRLGSFGGYGQMQVRNWRWEFDAQSGLWIEVEKNVPTREPRCRSTWQLLPLDGGRKLLLFGGHGNSTGQQGDRDEGFKIWTTHFHNFGDIWVLDLAAGKWECLVPAPGLELPNVTAAAYLAQAKVLVVAHASSPERPIGSPPEIFIHRLRKGAKFEKVLSRGELPQDLMKPFLAALPGRDALLTFLETGIYELTLEL
jgi:hypothetical protein